MVLVSAAMFWAFPAAEYIAMTKQEGRPPTKAWRAIGQALNFSDFVMEVSFSLRTEDTFQSLLNLGTSRHGVE